jgi:hypothetical protein
MAKTSAVAAAVASSSTTTTTTNRCIQKYITSIKAMSESTVNACISG